MSETIDAAIARLTREIAQRQRILESLRALVKLPTPVTAMPFTHYDGVTGCTCPNDPRYVRECLVAGCPRATRVTMRGHG